MKKIILCSFLLLSTAAWAQEAGLEKYSRGITMEELKEHVKILASEDLQGRETGLEGQKKAAEYLLGEFQKMELTGLAENEYPGYQAFELIRDRWNNFLVIEGMDTLKINEEISVTGNWNEGTKAYKLIFAGYGAETKLYSDYKGLDVSGSIVAFLNGEPMDKTGKFLTTGSFLPEYSILGTDKAKIAAEKGAVGTILIETDPGKIEQRIRLSKKFSGTQQFFLPGSGLVSNTEIGLIAMDRQNASVLFNNSPNDWDKYINKINKGKNTGKFNESQIIISTDRGSNKITGENVIGIIKGSEFPEEFVIVTAHYDHLGKNDDDIFYGADDNASGTAAVVEIAEAFKEAAMSGQRPKRSILFMPVAGEEKGLLGSRYYVANPLVPLENTRAVLNMDMIGRQDSYDKQDTSYVYMYVSDTTGSILDNIAKKASQTTGAGMETLLKYKGTDDFTIGGSDHASFENEGIPVVYLYCGTHNDYHRPSDTWEKLDYENMARISRTAFSIVWQLANQ